MYRIDRAANRIVPLDAKSFAELEFRERAHLQEWISARPDILGEELLIIQKEFAGFSDTRERLDLLALDKQGALVIIENKLDDTGRDVIWQALKYASYCASLTRDEVIRIYQDFLSRTDPDASARQRLADFLEKDPEDFDELSINRGITQRIMLVAASFRREVTSTVLWLLNFNVRLQCFRATPFADGDHLFLNIEQIIPLKDSEDFTIRLASKAKEELAVAQIRSERQGERERFWTALLQSMNEKSELFRNVRPQPQSWLPAGSGLGRVTYNFGATRTYGRVELYIDRGDKAENEVIFDSLVRERARIETAFGATLTWERLDAKRACRIKFERPYNVFDETCWTEMIGFMADAMLRFESALRLPLTDIRSALAGGGSAEGEGAAQT